METGVDPHYSRIMEQADKEARLLTDNGRLRLYKDLRDTFSNRISAYHSDHEEKIPKMRKQFINILLVTNRRNIPYIEFENTYRTDGSDVILKADLDIALLSLKSNTQKLVEGIEYKFDLKDSKKLAAATLWVEIEEMTSQTDALAWLNEVAAQWMKSNPPAAKVKEETGQAYTGFKIQI